MNAKAILAAIMAMPLFAVADAVRVYDVDDYVTDGLVLHFDGIRNVGATAEHDSSATTWANLGTLGTTHNATKTSAQSYPSGAADGKWCADGYQFNGKDYFAIGASVDLGGAATVELFVNYVTEDAISSYPVFFGDTSATDGFSVYTKKTEGNLNFKQNNANGKSDPNWQEPYIIAIFDKENSQTSIGDDIPPVWNTGLTLSNLGSAWKYAIGTAGATDTRKKDRMLVAKVCSVRIYNSVMGKDDLLKNRAVDEARYRNEASKGKGNDDVNVVVASNVDGIEGTEESGKWSITGGTHTFTAPTTRVVEFKVYSLNGYTIETWNGTSWDEAVLHVGASYTASTSDPKVRLTWLWTQTPLTTADVSDYVQDGLVLHFDGIRNVGATADHDSSATTWVNLGTLGSAQDATLTTLESNVPSGAAAGKWCADGYALKGQQYFAIGGTVALGGAMTTQVTADYDKSKQVASYPMFLGAVSDNKDRFGVYNASHKLHIKLLTQSAVYAANTWSGPFATAIYDATNKKVRIGNDVIPIEKDTDASGDLPDWAYAIGTARLSDANKAARMLVGTVESVRVYNRILEDTELELNRAIDEVRFNGNLTVVNGAIGETGENGKCSLPSGVYNLDNGTWTITAESVKVEGDDNYWPKLLVETYDATIGEWVATTAKPQWAESYTIDKAALGDSRIRLTWTWGKRIGLIISIH